MNFVDAVNKFGRPPDPAGRAEACSIGAYRRRATACFGHVFNRFWRRMDMETALKPRVSVVGRSVTTTSNAIAEHFGKLHKNVLRDIQHLCVDLPEDWCRLNFEPTSISVKQPNGGTREESAYRITRKGFSLLAMGFTGQRALRWKLAYIEAFDAMEAGLNPREATRPEPPAPWLVTPAALPGDLLRPRPAHRCGDVAMGAAGVGRRRGGGTDHHARPDRRAGWKFVPRRHRRQRQALAEGRPAGCSGPSEHRPPLLLRPSGSAARTHRRPAR
ncbi:MAG: Rha family transcriptional regulator, partial [Rhodocyclaceae bacterium]|nr:Rha family transcriptional regulator [Rhodocyclaceae bacterium]